MASDPMVSSTRKARRVQTHQTLRRKDLGSPVGQDSAQAHPRKGQCSRNRPRKETGLARLQNSSASGEYRRRFDIAWWKGWGAPDR